MDMEETFDVNFVFLEKRKYIQGATITNGLISSVNHWGLGSIERLIASFHRRTDEHGRYVLFKDAKITNLTEQGYCAVFNVYCGKDAYLIGLKGRGEPVVESVPYDEDGLITSCEVLSDEKSALLECEPPKPLINVLIALNKKLHLALLPSTGFGRWYLAKFDLKWRPVEADVRKLLKVSILRNIKGLSTKSLIEINGEEVGYIYFARELS
jgi:hypothetical protein